MKKMILFAIMLAASSCQTKKTASESQTQHLTTLSEQVYLRDTLGLSFKATLDSPRILLLHGDSATMSICAHKITIESTVNAQTQVDKRKDAEDMSTTKATSTLKKTYHPGNVWKYSLLFLLSITSLIVWRKIK